MDGPAAVLDPGTGVAGMSDGAAVTLFVCVTCRVLPVAPESEPAYPGRCLFEALQGAVASAGLGHRIRVEAVECLSVCKRPATVALAGPGRWTYVYGDLQPDDDLAAVIDGALAYAQTGDGLVPWKERPQIFKKGVVARIPPGSGPPATTERESAS